MIPPLELATGNLPPGVHEATWDELVARYGYNAHRRDLLAGLRAAIESLRVAGCRRVYVDGSFVTNQADPADFDACWELGGVKPGLLDPILLNFGHQREAQKLKYRGELFPAEVVVAPFGARTVEFFQRNRHTGGAKEIVTLDLVELP